MQKKDHLKAAFLSYVEHVSFFYFASRKRSLRSFGGPPGPRSPKGYLFCMQKKDHLKAAFLSYVEHVSFF
jgi:hypothetical protein